MNHQIASDAVTTVPILTQDENGEVSPADDGVTIDSTDPGALDTTIGEDSDGNPVAILKPIKDRAENIGISISDADGVQILRTVVDIVTKLKRLQAILDFGNSTTEPQPTPPVNPTPPTATPTPSG